MSKPRPGDQPLLIVFVLGGVSTTEVRQVRDVVSAAKTHLQVSRTTLLLKEVALLCL